MAAPTVFLSYSHEDSDWLKALRTTLAPLVHGGVAATWWDGDIAPGDGWREEIDRALATCSAAVLLVTRDFLASDFIQTVEMPYLLEAAKAGRVRLLWVPVGDSLWDHTPLKDIQAAHDPSRPLNTLGEGELDQALAAVAREVAKAIAKTAGASTTPGVATGRPDLGHLQRVSTARLPITSDLLLGREAELAELDAAWESPSTHVISLVAWGGVGKTALVNRWLGQMAQHGWRGAERVFGWSFYSQGSGEARGGSADTFLDAALRWFGETTEEAKAGGPWERGERLAGHVQRRRTLLVLDGLEPLQQPPAPGAREGRLKEPGLQALLRGLADVNPGLCVITTRQPVEDLAPRVGTTVLRRDLERLPPEAGAALLARLGVEGPEKELQEAAEAFAGHALALTLLGTYLRDVCRGDVRRRREVPLLDEDADQGGHAFRVMRSYEAQLGGPERAVLDLLGLFDRPAGAEEVAALRQEPAIPGLTEALAALGEAGWQRALSRLRRARLVAAGGGPGGAGALDAHPLVRTYFGDRLEEEKPEAFRAGHLRLYEHLKEAAEELPETVEAMQPLYHAVIHGCRAERWQQALDEVYWRRVLREGEHFSWSKLGSFSSDLAALSGFFEQPWDRPAAALMPAAQGFVLGQAGLYLRALGRLAEAVGPMRAGVAAGKAAKDWKEAAIRSGNLSELLLTLGRVEEAVAAARESVELADRSGDGFQRMVARTQVGDALHRAGALEEAAELFAEAESMQAERQPEYPLLYSLRGFLYCDLLLGAVEGTAPPPGDESPVTPSPIRSSTREPKT